MPCHSYSNRFILISVTDQLTIDCGIILVILTTGLFFKCIAKFLAAAPRFLYGWHLAVISKKPDFKTRIRPSYVNIGPFRFFHDIIEAYNTIPIQHNPRAPVLRVILCLFLYRCYQARSIRLYNLNDKPASQLIGKRIPQSFKITPLCSLCIRHDYIITKIRYSGFKRTALLPGISIPTFFGHLSSPDRYQLLSSMGLHHIFQANSSFRSFHLSGFSTRFP